jgi:hypothetical protein
VCCLCTRSRERENVGSAKPAAQFVTATPYFVPRADLLDFNSLGVDTESAVAGHKSVGSAMWPVGCSL